MRVGFLDAYPYKSGRQESYPMYASYLPLVSQSCVVNVLAPDAESKKGGVVDKSKDGFVFYTFPYTSGPTSLYWLVIYFFTLFKVTKQFVNASDIIVLRVPNVIAPLVEIISIFSNRVVIPYYKGSWDDGVKDMPFFKRIVYTSLGFPWRLYHEYLSKRYQCLSTGPYLQRDNVLISMFMANYTGLEVKTKQKDIDEKKSKLLCIGRLTYAKGVDLLLKAIDYKGINNDLLIVGDGPDRSKLESYVREHGLTNVQFVGNINSDAVKNYYEWADVVVIPSRTEGIPKVMLESIAYGKKVIAPRVGGIPFLHGVEKYVSLFDVGDYKMLGEIITLNSEINDNMTLDNEFPVQWVRDYDAITKILHLVREK